MFDKIKSLFSKSKSENTSELEFTEQIIKNIDTDDNLDESYTETKIPASIVTYIIDNDSSENPMTKTVILIENYTCNILPQENSIIWIENDNYLRPFKCIRYDYIQNSNPIDSMRVYIVVKPALSSDIIVD